MKRFAGASIWVLCDAHPCTSTCTLHEARRKHPKLCTLAAIAHARVAKLARASRDGSSMSCRQSTVDQTYLGSATSHAKALSYAAAALHCDPDNTAALYEAALEHGAKGESQRSQQCLKRCLESPKRVDEDDGDAFCKFLQEQKKDTATKAKDLLGTTELWKTKWKPVMQAVGQGNLKEIWGKLKKDTKKESNKETCLKALQNATDEQVKQLLESPPKRALNDVKSIREIYFESAECSDLQSLAAVDLKDIFAKVQSASGLQSLAGVDLKDAQKDNEQQHCLLVNAQNKARLLVKAFAKKPLRPLSQTSSTTEGLGIGTWNIRAYSGMHGIPSYDAYMGKRELGVLPRKLESLRKLVSSCSLQLIALQECPGRAMGFNEDAHVEKLLQSAAATGLPDDPWYGWKISSALCGKESATFLFNTSVLQMIHGPRVFGEEEEGGGVRSGAFPQAHDEADTDDEDAASNEDAVAPGSDVDSSVADTFRRPPILALFLPATGPEGHRLASAHGCLAVVSVHLKSYDEKGLAQTKAEVRGLVKHVVPWMEKRVEKWMKQEVKNAQAVTTYVIMGDYNLAEDDHDKASAFGGNDKFTFGGEAWSALKEQGFEPLLSPGEPTNMGPPVTKFDRCYDNILYKRVNNTASGECREPAQPARVFPVMEAELAEVKRLLDALDSVNTKFVQEGMAKFVQRSEMEKAWWKEQIFRDWSDHKPVYVHLSSTTDRSAGVE